MSIDNGAKAGMHRDTCVESGRAILYNSSVENVVNIWSQPVDGGKPKQVTDFKDSEISSFAWSRDGRSLALTRGTLVSDAVMISQVK